MKKVILSIIVLLAIFGCSSKDEKKLKISKKEKSLKIRINKQEDVKDIPSTSGLEWNNGKIYAISDDSPWVFELDKDWKLKNRLTLKDYPMENGRVPKKLKPDYEALAVDGRNLIVLGSGSKSPLRDYGYIVNLDTKGVKEIILTNFYQELKKLAEIEENKKINIEAVVATEEDIIIFHRGNNSKNLAFIMNKNEFYDYFYKNSEFPVVDAREFKLPIIDGFVSGFSGATYIPSKKALLITSSVEATGDAYNDGEILGSFIGYVTMDKFLIDCDLKDCFKLMTKDNNKLITKLESLSVKNITTEGAINVIAASDNDTGVSEFFDLTLEIK